MIRRLTKWDVGLLAVLALTIATLISIALTATPAADEAYEDALLALGTTGAAVDRDLNRLLANELRHYDTLVLQTRELRRLENALNHEPPGIQADGEFGRVRLEASVLLNQKLALVEEFKTALAEYKAALDHLPDVIDAVNESTLPADYSREAALALIGELAIYLQEPDTERGTDLAARIAGMAPGAGGDAPAGNAPSSDEITPHLSTIVAERQHLAALQQDLSALPLMDASVRLSAAYRDAHRTLHRRMVYLASAAVAILVLLMAGLAVLPRWRASRAETQAKTQQAALRTALNEARAQSAQMKRAEQDEGAVLAQERLAALVAHSFDMIAIISRQDNYIYVSPSSRDLLGLTEKELIGKSFYEGIHKDDIIKVQDYFTRAQKELQTDQTIQYRVMDAFGKWHLVETFASNQTSNPAVRGTVLNTRRLAAVDDGRIR